MRRLLLVALVALVATGAASADTFEVVGDQPAASTATALPSALAPNESGVMLPELLAAPVAPQQLGWSDLLPVWQAAGQAYGVPWSVLAAINKVESDFGQNMGPSSAGAIGWMQFMPDTWARWGVDANGDGLPDPWNAEDAIYSAARYLAATGGATDISSAVFSYNHAQWYVDEVLQLAQQYAGGSADFGPALEAAQADLDAAKQAVLDANQRVLDAQAKVTELQARADELLQEATSEHALQRPASPHRSSRHSRTSTSRPPRPRSRPASRSCRPPRMRSTAARDRAAGASFAPGSGQVLGSPSYSGGYVFPVAGGAGVVRVGHTHHDYPAADIAAPEGTQLYALSDGTVQDASSEPNGNCGIGFTIATTDGLVWTYCHLAYLEPTVVAGAQLAAGQPVGLVGQTGHATGPHLHLQLQPATAYPQDEPWFQSFAGSAFSWSDGFQTETGSGPVFEVVDEGSGSSRTLDSAAGPVVLFTTSGA